MDVLWPTITPDYSSEDDDGLCPELVSCLRN